MSYLPNAQQLPSLIVTDADIVVVSLEMVLSIVSITTEMLSAVTLSRAVVVPMTVIVMSLFSFKTTLKSLQTLEKVRL